MSEFQPVRTMTDLTLLDEDDVLLGYREGLDGAAEPGSDKSRSYWHGWRNAQVDRGWASADDAQCQLAREYVGRYVGLH
ncbi:hypothetical protein [Bordetella bronchiseptica]|uniref:hypothetical protein n=1 Tax=Bordetella bronchiseptica TaxID=518 RepID=UPI0005B98AC5|nr:hypothetical protein [Bordetella bronchiseptica]